MRYFGASEWATREPYAGAGGAALGRTPGSWVLEMRVTPFDDLVHDDEGLSIPSDLYAGKTIGFDIRLHDADEELARAGPDTYLLAAFGYSPSSFADHLVDGLLLGTGEDPSRYDDISAVAPSSWGRIKASFR